ncbi:hypothetical protein ABZ917_43805 [Nonomuraea wenchangensis]
MNYKEAVSLPLRYVGTIKSLSAFAQVRAVIVIMERGSEHAGISS